MFPCAAWSYSVTISGVTTDVGAVDTLISSTSIKSGSATEEAWIESVLGQDVVYSQFDKGYSTSMWIQTDVSGVYAFDFSFLGYSPDYYLIKTGAGKSADDHFLLENVDNLNWAVISLSELGIKNIGRISHLGFDDVTPTPEPVTLVLLGIGIGGLAMARRKFK